MRDRRIFLRSLLVLGLWSSLALSLVPSSAHADGSLTPWAGMYVPTQNEFSTVEADIKRNTSFITGVQMTWYPKGILGLEASAGYSPAKTEFADAEINEERNMNVWLASAKLLVGLSPKTSDIAVFAKAGPAYIRHSGSEHLNQDTSTFGGVLGAGMHLPFNDKVGLRLDVEDYMYGGTFDGEKKYQNDLVIGAGIAFGR